MAFDYEANAVAVRNVLLDHNTTTATPDLSSGLTTRIANIDINDPEVINLRASKYPVVFIRPGSKDEDFASLGNTGPSASHKRGDMLWEIIGLYRKDGGHTQHSDVTIEIMRLAENIEGVFEAELTLSGTALWCNPSRTDFRNPYSDDVLIKGVTIELQARYHFR